MALPRPITIVTGGQEDREWFLAHVDDQSEWHDVRLKDILKKDPGVHVSHWEDWRTDNVQRVVFPQTGFVSLIVNLIRIATGTCVKCAQASKFLLTCQTGRHRGGVGGNTFESNLNSLTAPWNGERLFNARCFPLNECRDQAQWDQLLNDIDRWDDAPW